MTTNINNFLTANTNTSSPLQLTGVAQGLPRPRLRLPDIFEPGLEVVWVIPAPAFTDLGELRVPADVTSVTRRRVQITFKFEDGHAAFVWVKAGTLRLRCTECHQFAAMPKSQICATCWNWKLAEDLADLDGEAQEATDHAS